MNKPVVIAKGGAAPVNKDTFQIEKCPQCLRKEYVGFLGGSSSKKYFCRECCLEFVVRSGKVETYNITVNGTVEEK